jgi:hypothetical protein
VEEAAYKELAKISNRVLVEYLEANSWEHRKSNLAVSNAIKYHRDGTFRIVILPNIKLPDFEHRWDENLRSLAMANDCTIDEAAGEIFEFAYQRDKK